MLLLYYTWWHFKIRHGDSFLLFSHFQSWRSLVSSHHLFPRFHSIHLSSFRFPTNNIQLIYISSPHSTSHFLTRFNNEMCNMGSKVTKEVSFFKTAGVKFHLFYNTCNKDNFTDDDFVSSFISFLKDCLSILSPHIIFLHLIFTQRNGTHSRFRWWVILTFIISFVIRLTFTLGLL